MGMIMFRSVDYQSRRQEDNQVSLTSTKMQSTQNFCFFKDFLRVNFILLL